MGTLTKKLHILKTGGTEETCNIYTTAEEVGGSPYLALEVDGAKGYVKLGSTTDANATHLRVEKDGVIYAAWKEAVTYVNVTITQSANQTIHVYTPQKSGGTDHTSSFTIPKGTSYEAEVIPADGYTAGTLNVNAGGRINSNMTFSASEASTVVPNGDVQIFGKGSFTVPNNVTVVSISNMACSALVGVTPGTTHTILESHTKGETDDGEPVYISTIECLSHRKKYATGSISRNDLFGSADDPETTLSTVTVSWSPWLNTLTPSIKDY